MNTNNIYYSFEEAQASTPDDRSYVGLNQYHSYSVFPKDPEGVWIRFARAAYQHAFPSAPPFPDHAIGLPPANDTDPPFGHRASRDGKRAARQYRSALKAAQRRYDLALSSYYSAIRDADKSIARAEEEHRMPVAVFGRLVLMRTCITDGTTSLLLDGSIDAWVDAGGSKYTTTQTKGSVGVSIGGAVVGGAIAGPLGAVVGGKRNKVTTRSTAHDERKLFVTVWSDQGMLVEEGNPDKEAQARSFAASVFNASRTVQEGTRLHNEALAALRAEREARVSNTSEIDRARNALAAIASQNPFV